MKSERSELVRGSDPPLVYSAHPAARDGWRAPTGLLLLIHLAAGVWKTETNSLDRPPTGIKTIFESI